MHGMGLGGFPTLGDAATYGVASTAEVVRKVGINLGGFGNRGVGV